MSMKIIQTAIVEYPCGKCGQTIHLSTNQSVVCCGNAHSMETMLHMKPEKAWIAKRVKQQKEFDRMWAESKAGE